ncbi:hypothetical protein IWQ57_003027 [Coemansia nantahalensis]|uniref:Uncharacterized protein n=2 Tax=Coemansia TaxID=4863 RepID=A0ACC1JY36_9FUNG|nr:hypothetical protein IWQ57_003027 [Coemansia nantahalensis]
MLTSFEGLHSRIQQRVGRIPTLEEVDFHEDWGHDKMQFVESMVSSGVLACPAYWQSPDSRVCVGLWHFTGKDLAPADPIQATTLLTLADDVTGELSLRMFNSTAKEIHMGLTASLEIAQTAVLPVARRLYFEAAIVEVLERKVVVECPIWDGETGVHLVTVKSTYAFIPLTSFMQRSKKTRNTSPPPTPHTSAPLPHGLPEDDLQSLDRAMSFLPLGRLEHKAGAVDEQAQSLVLVLDFGVRLSGPPLYVHGGIISTVLANASQLLFARSTGLGARVVASSTRRVRFLRGLPGESKDTVIEARVKSADRSQVVIEARLLRQGVAYTTLTTTYALAPIPSKL